MSDTRSTLISRGSATRHQTPRGFGDAIAGGGFGDARGVSETDKLGFGTGTNGFRRRAFSQVNGVVGTGVFRRRIEMPVRLSYSPPIYPPTPRGLIILSSTTESDQKYPFL
jgi:hypothetical protein